MKVVWVSIQTCLITTFYSEAKCTFYGIFAKSFKDEFR